MSTSDDLAAAAGATAPADTSGPPMWATHLYEMLNAQSQQLNLLAQVTQKLQANQGNQPATPPSEAPTPKVTDPIVQETPTEQAVRKKAKLPELPEFNGKRTEFRPWVIQVQAKLTIDKNEDSEAVRFWYVHSRLRGDALAQTGSWVESAMVTNQMTVEGLIGQLRAAYDDTGAEERASRKLSTLRQGSRSFPTFLAEFDRTLLDAGGVGWDDKVKKTFLANCLSYDLASALVAATIPSSYKEYCTLLQTVSANIEAAQRKKKDRGVTTT